ncbi:hypothetical protein HPDP_00910 [Candidatus Hepatincola sp. Pdp]
MNTHNTISKHKTITVDIKNLLLKEDNLRHGYKVSSQQEVINWFIKNHKKGQKHYLRELSKDIIDYEGLMESPYIYQLENGRYEVIDGNTRVCCLKLMIDSNLMLEEDILFNKTILDNLLMGSSFSSKLSNMSNNIDVLLIEDKQDIDEIIKRKHIAGHNKQVGINPHAQSIYMEGWYNEIQKYYDDYDTPIARYLWERYLNTKGATLKTGVKINKNNKLEYISDVDTVRYNIQKLAKAIYTSPERGQVKPAYMQSLINETLPEDAPINKNTSFNFDGSSKDEGKSSTKEKRTYNKPVAYDGIKGKVSFAQALTKWMKQLQNHHNTPLYNILKDFEHLNDIDLLKNGKLKFIPIANIRLILDSIANLVLENPQKKGTNLKGLIDILGKMNNNKEIELDMKPYSNYNDLNEYVHGRFNLSKEHNFYTEIGYYEKLIDLLINYIHEGRKISF